MDAFPGKLIFVGGSPRSGTTLVRQILHSHPEICSGPELDLVMQITSLWKFAQFRIKSSRTKDYSSAERMSALIRDLIFKLLDPYREATGKRHIAEKTPSNVMVFTDLYQLFPEDYFIHVIRDGRDVICSMLEVEEHHEKDRVEIPHMINKIDSCAKTWLEYVQAPQKNHLVFYSEDFQKQYYVIRYEELIFHPVEVIQQLCSWLGVEYSEKMSSHHLEDHKISYDNRWFTKEKFQAAIHTESHERWENDLSFFQRLVVAYYCQSTLIELGHARDKKWIYKNLYKSLWLHPIEDFQELFRLGFRFVLTRIFTRSKVHQ